MKAINQAISVFNSGGVVIFPTDTAFGIGCRIDNIAAIKRLIQIKLRSENQALPILVSDIKMAEKYFMTPLPKKIYILMEKYWPGGLTIVYQANKELIPNLIMGHGENIGLRIPDNKQLRIIIENIGVPIIGTSANIHNQATPYSINQLNKQLIKQVDYVLPGECGGKQTSTVLDCTQSPWKILRQGGVKIKIDNLI